MRYFLGADLGSTKTHILITDETGRALGFGESGPANHQSVAYQGMYQAMHAALEEALHSSGLSKDEVAGAGFGVAGYDWPSEDKLTAQTIGSLGLKAPIKFVNDAIAALVAGAEQGWGVAVVSGTGCNCRGWDADHRREGRVTGYGILMGEFAGSSELVYRAMQVVGHAWTKRIPETALIEAFIGDVGANDVEDLMEGYTEGRYLIGAGAAPLIFRVAEQGDAAARNLIHWAGYELGEMACGVIRQLEFENLAFDVVLAGGMFEGGPLLIEPTQETILGVAPQAHFVRLKVPPVMGAVVIGMEAFGLKVTPEIRARIQQSISATRQAK
jgi:N-acetylglucosamine kinase-like BadF-type ATPase